MAMAHWRSFYRGADRCLIKSSSRGRAGARTPQAESAGKFSQFTATCTEEELTTRRAAAWPTA